MSKKARQIQKERERRERIRLEKHQRRLGLDLPAVDTYDPPRGSRYIMERINLLVGRKSQEESFESIEELNARLQQMSVSGELNSAHRTAYASPDRRERAQEFAFRAMECFDQGDSEEAAYWAANSIALDKHCIDGMRIAAILKPGPAEEFLNILFALQAVAKGDLGEDFFEENAGRFWGVVETRPYMRLLVDLATGLNEAGLEGEAIEVFEEMLKLNETDNLGARFNLLGLYLATGNLEAAARLLDAHEGRDLALFRWGRVLERYLTGDLEGAAAALGKARDENPHYERFLSGRREPPEETPAYFKPGDESEAICSVDYIRSAWRHYPAAVEWLAQGGRATADRS